jgi:hypothetical protein
MAPWLRLVLVATHMLTASTGNKREGARLQSALLSFILEQVL